MEVRKFNPEQDYLDVSAWWTAHKWPTVSLDLLPQNGFIAECDNQKIAAGWIYMTDSKFAILEWMVGNPKTDRYMRSTALDVVIKKLLESAKANGKTTVFTSTEHPGLIDRYLGHGFVETDKNMTNLIARIQ